MEINQEEIDELIKQAEEPASQLERAIDLLVKLELEKIPSSKQTIKARKKAREKIRELLEQRVELPFDSPFYAGLLKLKGSPSYKEVTLALAEKYNISEQELQSLIIKNTNQRKTTMYGIRDENYKKVLQLEFEFLTPE